MRFLYTVVFLCSKNHQNLKYTGGKKKKKPNKTETDSKWEFSILWMHSKEIEWYNLIFFLLIHLNSDLPENQDLLGNMVI